MSVHVQEDSEYNLSAYPKGMNKGAGYINKPESVEAVNFQSQKPAWDKGKGKVTVTPEQDPNFGLFSHSGPLLIGPNCKHKASSKVMKIPATVFKRRRKLKEIEGNLSSFTNETLVEVNIISASSYLTCEDIQDTNMLPAAETGVRSRWDQ